VTRSGLDRSRWLLKGKGLMNNKIGLVTDIGLCDRVCFHYYHRAGALSAAIISIYCLKQISASCGPGDASG